MPIKICKKEAKESHYWLRLSSPTKNYEHSNTEEIHRETKNFLEKVAYIYVFYINIRILSLPI